MVLILFLFAFPQNSESETDADQDVWGVLHNKPIEAGENLAERLSAIYQKLRKIELSVSNTL